MSKPRLTNQDYCRAAKKLRCKVSMIKAVAEQESLGSGFDAQDRPKILFERHYFHKLTKGRFDHSHPNISQPSAGGYGSSASQYDRFSIAFELDPKAAMMSASWGKFQILGANFAICGFSNVGDFVDAMKRGEPEQLDAFCEFVIHNHLDDELRRMDAAGFARGYNGPGYKKNNYDVLILQRERKFAKENIDCGDILEIDDAIDAIRTDQISPVAPPAVSESTIPPDTNALPSENESHINNPSAEQPATTLETKTLNAPPAEGSTSSATKMTLLGIGVPTFLTGIVSAFKQALAEGYVNTQQVGDAVLGLVTTNTKYFLMLIGIIIGLLIVKKVCKQVTLWIQMWIHSDPTRHDVEIKPQ